MIDHLSVSQLDMFYRCGEQYRRRYVEGEIIPPGIAARIGAGVHKAAETNYKLKMQTGADMPLDSICDCAADAYEAALREGVYFAPEEIPGARLAMAEGKDSAIALAALFRNELAPKIRPAMVEEKLWLDLPGVDLPIMAILDLYTEDKALRDLKTAAKKWPEEKARSSGQPVVYREAIKQATGEYPKSIYFDVLVKGKSASLQSLETERDSGDAAILARKFQLMLASVKAGLFLPAEPGSWACGPKFCGYYYTCPHIPARGKILPKRSE